MSAGRHSLKMKLINNYFRGDWALPTINTTEQKAETPQMNFKTESFFEQNQHAICNFGKAQD